MKEMQVQHSGAVVCAVNDVKTCLADLKGNLVQKRNKGAIYSKMEHLAIIPNWGCRIESLSRRITAVWPGSLTSMSVLIQAASLTFSGHFIGLSSSFVLALREVNSSSSPKHFNHSRAIS